MLTRGYDVHSREDKMEFKVLCDICHFGSLRSHDNEIRHLRPQHAQLWREKKKEV